MSKEIGGTPSGTTDDSMDTGAAGTTDESMDTAEVQPHEDAQSSDEIDYWAEAVESLSGNSDASDTADTAPPKEEEVLSEEPQAEKEPVKVTDSKTVQDTGDAKLEKMLRDTKADHTRLAQENAEMRKQLETLESQLNPKEEVSDADPVTRGDVKENFEKLYEERKQREAEAVAKAAREAARAQSDQIFYDKVRSSIPEFDTLVKDPEFLDWHSQHKNWSDSQINSVDVDDSSGMVAVFNRYKSTVLRRDDAVKSKSSRLTQTLAPTGNGSPKNVQGDDYTDALRAVSAKVSKTSFTGFI